MEVYRRSSLTQRMLGASLLNIATYEEVEHDRTATGQAALVVGIAAIAAAIGGVNEGAVGVFGGLIGAFVGWLLWAGVTYLIGDKLLGGTATWGELLRTLGFAQAPRVLLVLAIIPLLGWLVRAVVAIWLLITGFLAIRQALDFGTGRTLLTAVLGWLAMMILSALLIGI